MKKFIYASAFLSLIGSISPAMAEDPTSLGVFDDWEAFSYQSEGAPTCYVLSSPKNTQSDKKISKRDSVYFMVTHFSARKIKNQVSTIIGYPFKESSVVDLKVDTKSFELYTNGDTAWAAAPEVESAIVKAMRAGKNLNVTAISWKGTQTVDSYSLLGIGKALEKINEACS